LTLSPGLIIKIENMPTYQYVCEKCGHEFEKFQPISAEPLKVCPQDQCAKKRWGKGSVKRAITGGAGLLFKGSGFYITDYRSDKYKEAAKKDTAPASSGDSGSKSSGGGESKTAPKTSESKPAKAATPKT
jgi:putative FmdB family regulatory protein